MEKVIRDTIQCQIEDDAVHAGVCKLEFSSCIVNKPLDFYDSKIQWGWKKEPVFFCVRLFQYLKETGERFHMY